jgi:AcrR family transcriptional regulator
MARRSDHSKEELKELALRKGLEIIDENGLSGLSARGVTKAMGYTVGTLYHTFGNLDQYMLCLNGRILDEWYQELTAGLKRTKKDPLLYLSHAYISFAQQHYNRWTTLFEFRPAEQADVPDWYAEKMANLFRLVEHAILPHSKEALKARRDAKVLWAGIHGICVLSLSGKLDTVGADKVEILTDSLLEKYLLS